MVQRISDRRAFVAGATAAALALPAATHTAAAQAPPPGAPDDPRPRSYDLLGKPAPAFDLPKHGGGRAQLSDYAGRWLILDFWGIWCPDCILDGPHVAALARGSEAAGVAFLAIHTRGRYGRWGSIAAYFAETGYAYPTAIDEGRATPDAYAIKWTPSYLAVDPNGVIRLWRTDLGEGGADAFLAAVRRLAAG